MLTKNDLFQIRKVIREEVQVETKKIVQEETPKIVQKIIQEETPKIVEKETKKIIQKELKPIKADIVKIRKDIGIIVSIFDRKYLELRQRVEKIEKHLNLPSSINY
jgi:hypothetical protein